MLPFNLENTMKDSIKLYKVCVDWVQDGLVHTKLFQGETYTTVFDQAYDFAAFIRESVGLPMSDISIIDYNSEVLL